ncbi:MAG: PrgI family protein [Firmicutes bacterium]|nr:PrgI family protein [Bacillota bacterium]
MREYPVPLPVQGEEKLMFKLSGREFIAVLTGLIFGGIAASLLSICLNTQFLLTLPVAIPFIALTAYPTFKRVKKIDANIGLDRYIVLRLSFRKRPRHYLMLRK